MSDEDGNEFEFITTDAVVETFTSVRPIFDALLREVRELSKKKPEATMSISKVKVINRVLADLLTILKDEPAGKYLDELDAEALPQMSDAVLSMVQFEAAMEAFRDRYWQDVHDQYYWITKELLEAWNEEEQEEE